VPRIYTYRGSESKVEARTFRAIERRASSLAGTPYSFDYPSRRRRDCHPQEIPSGRTDVSAYRSRTRECRGKAHYSDLRTTT